jgi:predicted chitinase
MSNKITKDFVVNLNSVLQEFNISTKDQREMFLATCMHESRTGLIEEGYEDQQYRGSGYIQLTGRANYEAFYNYMKRNGIDDPDIVNIGMKHVAAYYPWESAGYFWEKEASMNRRISDDINKGLDRVTIFKKVSNMVYSWEYADTKKPADWESRLARYEEIRGTL